MLSPVVGQSGRDGANDRPWPRPESGHDLVEAARVEVGRHGDAAPFVGGVEEAAEPVGGIGSQRQQFDVVDHNQVGPQNAGDGRVTESSGRWRPPGRRGTRGLRSSLAVMSCCFMESSPGATTCRSQEEAVSRPSDRFVDARFVCPELERPRARSLEGRSRTCRTRVRPVERPSCTRPSSGRSLRPDRAPTWRSGSWRPCACGSLYAHCCEPVR